MYYWMLYFDDDFELGNISDIHSSATLDGAIRAAKKELGKEWVRDGAIISATKNPSDIIKKKYAVGTIVPRSSRTRDRYYLYYPVRSKHTYYLDQDGKRVSITPQMAKSLGLDYSKL